METNYAEHTTGVGYNITEVDRDMCNEPNITTDSQKKEYEQQDDEISIENETPQDIHLTINVMNTIHEMNARQLNVDPDTGEAEEEEINTLAHRYIL